MAQEKSRRKNRPSRPTTYQSRRWKIALIIGAVVCLSLSAIIMGAWRSRSVSTAPTALNPWPTPNSAPTPNPFVPKRAAKEYIYVGGKMQAIEEPAPPIGGSGFDFNGNGSGDAVVFRPADGNWYVLDLATNTASLQQLGFGNETLVPGDYDGDAKTDIAIWRPNTGVCTNNTCGWQIKQSSDGAVHYYADWGMTGDVAVPADYDGDGKLDRAVWRPSEGNWYIVYSSLPAAPPISWGNNGDKPVPADYDGDGKADAAVFRPGDGNWYILKSSGGTIALGWGAVDDWLAPADYDGDGKADITVWRPSDGNWYIRQSSNNATRLVNWGGGGDLPVPADYDGDGRTDIAVWRPSDGNWYVRKSSDGLTLVRNWGQQGDQPVPAAFVR